MRGTVGKSLITAVLCVALAACGTPRSSSSGAPASGSGEPAAGQALTQAKPALATTPACAVTWGSGDRIAGTLSSAPLLTAETGRHECWDRVVFEFNGAAQGYSVRYSDQVATEGQGVDLVPYTAGAAHLWVTLLAPAGSPAFDARSGAHVANVVSYDTLRDVVFGGSFEGYSTFAVGVRARLPFRVTTLTGPGTHSRIVLDVAHHW